MVVLNVRISFACHRSFNMEWFANVYTGSETWAHLVKCPRNSSKYQSLVKKKYEILADDVDNSLVIFYSDMT